MPRPVTRERDEQVLGWVSRRAGGESAHAIAQHERINSGLIVTATNAVRDADLAESGEPEKQVRRAYW